MLLSQTETHGHAQVKKFVPWRSNYHLPLWSYGGTWNILCQRCAVFYVAQWRSCAQLAWTSEQAEANAVFPCALSFYT